MQFRFVENYIRAISAGLFKFSGRMAVFPYWSFVIIHAFTIMMLRYGLYWTIMGSVWSMILFYLFMGLPLLSATARRLHDCDRSLWYLLIPVYNVILLFSRGDDRANRYGTPPSYVRNDEVNEIGKS